MSEDELQQLTESIAKGVEAEEQLANFFWKKIYRTTSRFGLKHDERVDIVHETIGILLSNLRTRQFRGEASLETFVTSIARNLCLDAIKKSKNCPLEIHIPIDGEGTHVGNTKLLLASLDIDPMQSAQQNEREDILKKCVEGALKNREEWAIFTLCLKGFTRTEISEMLTIPLGRVDLKIHHGKKKVRKYLQRHFEQELPGYSTH